MEPVTLSCGHITNVSCHVSHKAQCVEPCEKILPCGHQCSEKCGKTCRTYCEADVEVELICSHHRIVPCHSRKQVQLCTSNCGEILNCGHVCQEKCGNICTVNCQKVRFFLFFLILCCLGGRTHLSMRPSCCNGVLSRPISSFMSLSHISHSHLWSRLRRSMLCTKRSKILYSSMLFRTSMRTLMRREMWRVLF